MKSKAVRRYILIRRFDRSRRYLAQHARQTVASVHNSQMSTGCRSNAKGRALAPVRLDLFLVQTYRKAGYRVRLDLRMTPDFIACSDSAQSISPTHVAEAAIPSAAFPSR